MRAARRPWGAPRPPATTRAAVRLAAIAASLALPLLAPGGEAPRALAQAAPVWPAPDVVANLRGMLAGYYGQRADETTVLAHLAPLTEADKAAGAKDPDTLWEEYARPGRGIVDPAAPSTACHAAVSDADFVRCAGARLAAVVGTPYTGGLTLADVARGFYFNDRIVRTAGHFALYHAFVHDFDAPIGADAGHTAANARQAQAYHRRMVRAYEAHMRDTLVRLFRDTRARGDDQLSLTRSAGWLLTPYVWTLQFLEEQRAWGAPADRRNAVALVNGLNQRVWWEWVAAQPEGPRTAGRADIGSQATYAAAAAGDPSVAGTDAFHQGDTPATAATIPSLRPAGLDVGADAGLWFDADYTLPGEDWCGRFGVGSADWQACMTHASRESLGGTKSPFGSYYGGATCATRPGAVTGVRCGQTNLGSMAEEWLGTHVGARAGTRLVRWLVESRDPDAPPGAVGPGFFEAVDTRLGYGVAGYHGGAGRQDDLEWPAAGGTHAVRTLSAGRHDGEAQNGRLSVGEDASLPGATHVVGDNWENGAQEFPGGIENHYPGPSPLYGAVLFGQVLDDKLAEGMAGSLFDTVHRNHPDEFAAWLWLFQATFYRCTGVDDPVDDRCFTFSPSDAGAPPGVRRQPLFHDPTDASVPLGNRYLWRNGGLIAPAAVAVGPTPAPGAPPGVCAGACRGDANPGLPWRRMTTAGGAPSPYHLTEHGYGAYGLLLQSSGGLMRLAAARHPLPAPDAGSAADFDRQRIEDIAPWYGEARRLANGIVDLLRTPPPQGYGYIPDVENSACTGEPALGDPDPSPLAWKTGTCDTVGATLARRAMWYSSAAVWYWWWDSDWLDVNAAWDRGNPEGWPPPPPPTANTGRLANISTRGYVGLGDDAMIGGFIVEQGPVRVLIRALGPSLAAHGVPGVLADPTLDLYRGATRIAVNDDWPASPNAGDIAASALRPPDDREAAMLYTLDPGAYTALVRGAGGGTGVALVEVFRDRSADPVGAGRVANLSTRGSVRTGDNVMIGGFIITDGPAKVVLRALGPDLARLGVPGALADPLAQLFRGASLVVENDNWVASRQAAAIAADPLAPRAAREAVIVRTLNAGAYTAIVRGVGGTSGVGLVEVFDVKP